MPIITGTTAMTEDEARRELEGDTPQSLQATFEEYCGNAPLPADRTTTINMILAAMLQEGHITSNQTFKLSQLARDLKINPKVARDKMRRADAKGKAPTSVKAAGWVFSTVDRSAIITIIQRQDDEQQL
jgi:hypothetical protein